MFDWPSQIYFPTLCFLDRSRPFLTVVNSFSDEHWYGLPSLSSCGFLKTLVGLMSVLTCVGTIFVDPPLTSSSRDESLLWPLGRSESCMCTSFGDSELTSGGAVENWVLPHTLEFSDDLNSALHWDRFFGQLAFYFQRMKCQCVWHSYNACTFVVVLCRYKVYVHCYRYERLDVSA